MRTHNTCFLLAAGLCSKIITLYDALVPPPVTLRPLGWSARRVNLRRLSCVVVWGAYHGTYPAGGGGSAPSFDAKQAVSAFDVVINTEIASRCLLVARFPRFALLTPEKPHFCGMGILRLSPLAPTRCSVPPYATLWNRRWRSIFP